MGTLYFITFNKTIDNKIFSQLLSIVSLKRQERISKIRFPIDKKLSLFSELIVRMLICQTICLDNDQITFMENQYGKPYLIGHPNFHYNISHTRDAIVVIVSDKQVGVDIERIGKADIEIARRFFTKNELNYITAFSESESEKFYEIWTKKEAYVKYIGKGLSIPLNSFDVLSEKLEYLIKTVNKKGYIISFCSDDVLGHFDIVELSQEDVINKALKMEIHN